jgi:hypothetical protein
MSRTLTALSLCAALLLAACGGGDPAEYASPDKFIGPPDCVNNPKGCI